MTDEAVDMVMKFQSTRLREARHWQQIAEELDVDISIHSPPRGETLSALPWLKIKTISIHSPPRGETSVSVCLVPKLYHFNPLASERRDVQLC